MSRLNSGVEASSAMDEWVREDGFRSSDLLVLMAFPCVDRFPKMRRPPVRSSRFYPAMIAERPYEHADHSSAEISDPQRLGNACFSAY